MKFSLFDNFGAKNSAPVFDALRRGIESLGLTHSRHDLDADVAVIWSVVWAGAMAPNQKIWEHYRRHNRPVIVLEVGMIQRGLTWKMAVNGTGAYAFHGQGLDLNRPQKLGLSCADWHQTGDRIIVCAQRTDSLQWATQPPLTQWLAELRDRVRLYTTRPLVVRAHPRQRLPKIPGYSEEPPVKLANTYDDFDFPGALENAWAVINHNSGPGVQAVLQGIPAFVDASSLAAPVANLDIANIEAPTMPDRGRWLIQLSHTEWTVPEIAQGWPLMRLLPALQPR
jgi:hypothetical protein